MVIDIHSSGRPKIAAHHIGDVSPHIVFRVKVLFCVAQNWIARLASHGITSGLQWLSADDDLLPSTVSIANN
jgi:hypothetical protein